MSEDLTNNIQQWVSLDNEIREHQDALKQIRKQRNDITENILTYVDTNGLNHATIKISDGTLRFIETRQSQPLTLRYIEDCLVKCIDNQDSVQKIMQFIKTSREIKTNTDIKRIYK